MSGPPTTIILGGDLTVQDIARALQYSGFAISNTGTVAPHLFVINRNPDQRLPPNVVEFEPPAFLRRQAD